MKRAISFFMALSLLFSMCALLFPTYAWAEEECCHMEGEHYHLHIEKYEDTETADIPDTSAEPETAEVVGEHEHKWVKATCTEPKTCSICGATEGEAKGHSVKEWKVSKKPTCTETGTKKGKCTVCGKTVTKEVKAKGHTVKEWKVTKKATCYEGGTKKGECTACGKTITKDTKPKGHTASDKWSTKKAPTSDDKTLVQVKKCVRCGIEMETKEKKLTESEYKKWFKEHCKTYDYKKLARKPSSYEGKRIKISGRVLQVQESSGWVSRTVMRVATKGNWDNVFYVTIYGKLSTRILEGDRVTLWGEYGGLKTYETILGGSVTIPQMEAEYYSIK